MGVIPLQIASFAGGNRDMSRWKVTYAIDTMPSDLYHQFIVERESRFQVIDRVRERLSELPQEEVECDVAEVLAAIKAASAGGA